MKTPPRDDRNDEQRWEILSMKAVDGALDAAERAELERLLEASPERRAELADYVEIKQATDGMAARIRADARIEAPRPGPATRTWVGVCFLLAAVGAALLLGYSAWEFFANSDAPPLVKLGMGMGGAGLLGLAAWVVKNRLRGASRDPYREIDR